MFLNEHKGWYGNFSGAGKTSAIAYKALLNQQKKLSKKHHFDPYKLEGLAPEVQKAIHKHKDDNIDIFQLDNTDHPNLTKSSCSTLVLKRNQSDFDKRYFYHNKHRNQKRIGKPDYIPGCTDYHPKYTLTLSRSVSGAAWNTLTGRKDLARIDSPNSKFYIEKESILSTKAGKSFVDMSKQTSRPDTGKRYPTSTKWQHTMSAHKERPLSSKLSFSQVSKLEMKFNTDQENCGNIEISSNCNNDKGMYSSPYTKKSIKKKTHLRPFTAKPLHFLKDKQLKSSESCPLLINESPSGTIVVSSFSNQSNIQDNNNINQQISTQTEDSYEEYKQYYLKLFKKPPKTSITTPKTQSKISKITKIPIKAPDFQKTISREHIAMLNDKKKALISFSLPNYKHVRERPLSMVVYDRKNYSKPKAKKFKGINSSINYDPDKMISKVNNHKRVQTPDFRLMGSRPVDDDPLPSYMKQLYNRNSCYQITALSLKMNNYANGVFIERSNQNWHKKTYNKIINLNLLNNKEFVRNFVKDQKKFEKEKSPTAKSFKFYKKNYKDLLKDEMISRFDNVTYKTKTKHQFLNPKEVERFILEK